jgi:hypothetical protein
MQKLPGDDRWEDSKLLADVRKADAACNALGREFGLSPTARTRINVAKPEESAPVVAPNPRPRFGDDPGLAVVNG